MTTLDYTGLRLTGALRIEHLGSISLHVGVNDHGWAVVEGEAGEDALEQLQGAVAGREQIIMARDESGVEQPLFAGIIRTADLVTYGGYNRFRIELQTGTIQMDQVKRSRSFQDVGQTYSQVAQRVASEYEDGAVIPTVGLDKPLGIPVIQYRETDWAFMKRLASWCGGVVVPESHYSYPRLWFGFPERAFTCSFPEDCYTVGISQRYFELGGAAAGYRRADFLYYDVPSSQMCDLGWYTVFKGQEFLICEKWAKLERGELTFTYRLGKPGLGWGRKEYNEKISGMTILGEVLSTERETVRLKLDIDEGWAPGGPYAYTWRPETGNMMYCMPQAGTRVSLYFPNYDEQAAMAANCVRTNGSSCARMSDPSKRSFVTEHGKEMNLYPEELSFIGGANGTVKLKDETGITLSTDKKITIVAQGTVSIFGKTAVAAAPMGELILSKGNILNNAIETSMSQSGQYDFLSVSHTLAEGWLHQEFDAIADAPKEGRFDWGGLFCNILAGLAVVAVVAVACTGIGILAVGAGVMAASTASAIVTGAVVGGVVSVGVCAAGDILSGEVSSMSDYIFAAASGAITGAIFGGVGASSFFQGLGKVIPSKELLLLARSGVMGITGFGTGMVNNIAAQLYSGSDLDEIDWEQALGVGAFSGVTAGLFFWGGSKLMQLKPIQQLMNKMSQTAPVRALSDLQTKLTNFIESSAEKARESFSRVMLAGGELGDRQTLLSGEEWCRYFRESYGADNVTWENATPSQLARSWQGSGKYPGVDDYVDITVKKGTILYRGEPNGTEYFTTLDAIEQSDKVATKIFEGLQVEKNPIHGYRGIMQGYIFNDDVASAYGITYANIQFGAGGLPQYYIPNVKDLIEKGILVPVDCIKLLM